MLGWLKMDVDQYIIVYSNLAAAVFSEKLGRILVNIKGKVKPQFNSVKLKSVIKKVLAQSSGSKIDLLNDKTKRRCRT